MQHSRSRHLPLIACALTLCLIGTGAQAATITVPGMQPTIQAAVTAAAPGDEILVSDGTYIENVTINKNVRLVSVNGRATTTIEGISFVASLGAIVVTSATAAVEIGDTGQGFTIKGIDNDVPGVENAAIYFQGGHSGAKVIDNEVIAQGDHGLLTEYGATIDDFTISANTFSGSSFFDPPAGNGFSQQFTLPNVPRQLVTMGCGGGCTSTSNITFTNNMITGAAGGFNTDPAEQGNTLVTIDADGAVITGNTFAGTTTRLASSLRCRGPNTTISGNNFDSAGIEHPLKATGHIYLQNIGTNSGAVVTANTFNKVVNIDAPVTTIGWSVAVFAALAPTGSTVDIGPGTYVEQIVIDGVDITLKGAGKTSTFIQSPAIVLETFNTGLANKPIITATNSPNIRVEDVTIDGLGLGNANYRFMGIAFWNAGGALLNSTVQGITETPLSGSQHGVGIYSYNITGGPYSLEVGDCDFNTCQKNAMALSGDGMVVDVHDCTTTGDGDVTEIAQNGIQVSFGAGGSITDCTVDGYRWTPALEVASGVLTYACGSPVTMSGNTLITNCQAPVSWYDTEGTAGNCEIPDGADFDAIFVYNSTSPFTGESSRPLAQPMLEDYTVPQSGNNAVFTVNVSGGCLTGTSLAGTSGIYALASGDVLNLNISNMTISGWDTGVFLDGTGVLCTANENSISGNTTAGLDNSASGNSVDAEFNWWGAADGPSGAGTGAGDAVLEGGFAGSVDFDPYLIDGTSTTACAFNGLGNTVTPVPEDPCVSTLTPCNEVSFEIARTDGADMRGFSVTFQLSPELELCTGVPSIVEGTYLSSAAGASTIMQVLDNTGGSYTVDVAILGLPCGQTAPTGTLFTAGVKGSGGDATGTVTITEVRTRDCINAPLSSTAGGPATIVVDNNPPVAITNISATQITSGNDSDGTTGITVDFTAPGDAAVVEVYRAGFGFYPEYDDAGGSEPAAPTYPPAAPWALTGVTATGQIDEVATPRDFYYYVAFTKDACGNVSLVSNKTGGTLNYHLGDVSDGTTPGTGDNLVEVAPDITLLGNNYGASLIFNDPVNYLDVGPTSTTFVDGLPLTDNEIEFEDLIIFAINTNQVSATGTTAELTDALDGTPGIQMRSETVAGGIDVHLDLVDNPGTVKGLHVVLDTGGLELVAVEQGGLLDAQAYPVFFADLPEGGANGRGVGVHAAIFGHETTIHGQGEIATIHLRNDVRGSVARDVTLELVDLRSILNEPLGDVVTTAISDPDAESDALAVGTPERFELLGATPNPFNPSTTISFRLPERSTVLLQIFDVSGRALETIINETLDPGEHAVRWDGRDGSGRELGSGVYFYAITAGDVHVVDKLVLVR